MQIFGVKNLIFFLFPKKSNEMEYYGTFGGGVGDALGHNSPLKNMLNSSQTKFEFFYMVILTVRCLHIGLDTILHPTIPPSTGQWMKSNTGKQLGIL